MNKISCDVIRDLLPSYTDGIASGDSVKLIEDHLAQCSECTAFKARMGKPDLHIADETDKIDYLKEIRKQTDLKSAVCFLLILITGAFFLGYTKGLHLHEPKPFFILVAVMLVCNYLLFFHNNQSKATPKTKAMIVNAVSILLPLYIIGMMQISAYNWLNNKSAPFHVDYEDLGPFLHTQFLLVMMIEIIIWIRELILHIRKARFSIISSSFGIIGFYMSLYYIRMLKTTDTLDGFSALCQNALLMFAEGIGILFFIFLIEREKKKNTQTISHC